MWPPPPPPLLVIFFTQNTTYFRRLLLLVGLKLGLCVLKSLRGVSSLHIWAFNWPVKPESFQSTKFLIVCHITAFLCILCIQECFHVYLTPISSSFFTKFALSKYCVILYQLPKYCVITRIYMKKFHKTVPPPPRTAFKKPIFRILTVFLSTYRVHQKNVT